MEGNSTFTVTSAERRYIQALAKLAEQHPEEVELVAQNKDGSVMYHIPASYVHIYAPRKVNMTDEQKAAFVKRVHGIRG